jgi:geranylgeranyl pyrophosphate synthase
VGGRDYARKMAMTYYRQALRELDKTGLKGQSMQNLKEAAALVVERDF